MQRSELARTIWEKRQEIKKVIEDLSEQRLDVEIMELPDVSRFNFAEVLKKWSELDRELLNCQDILSVKRR